VKVLLNVALFQAGWFACVLGAARGMPWLGPLVVLVAVALHLRVARRPLLELYLLLSAAAVGLVVDSLLLSSGWLEYPSGLWLAGFAPYWIVAMWMLFATTLNVSLAWLHGRPVLAALLGAVGGPLSYLGGEKLGGISLLEPVHALAALAVAWAIAMPALMSLAARLDGMTSRRTPDFVQSDWRVTGDA
jgi:hypothetical protein